jgi:hypothetical protein
MDEYISDNGRQSLPSPDGGYMRSRISTMHKLTRVGVVVQ